MDDASIERAGSGDAQVEGEGQTESSGDSTRVQLQQVTRAMMMSGPLPPPQMIAAYEDVLPGSAERILSMAEQAQKQRHDREVREA